MPTPFFKLPSFPGNADIYTWVDGNGGYLVSVADVECQLYFGAKNHSQVWLEHYEDPVEINEYAAGPIYVLFFFPKGTDVHDWYGQDNEHPWLIRYKTDPFDHQNEFYVVHQVERRWAGFSNEHLVAVCSRCRPSSITFGVP